MKMMMTMSEAKAKGLLLGNYGYITRNVVYKVVVISSLTCLYKDLCFEKNNLKSMPEKEA